MTLDCDAEQTPEVLARVLDGLHRLPDQRTGEEPDLRPSYPDTAVPAGVLPRRR